MRVLHVVDSLAMGGAETWLMELLRFWARRDRVEMDLLATGGRRQIFDDEAAALGARIHYVRYGRAQLASFRRAFRKILREGRYDAIHDHGDYASGWHWLLGLGVLPPVRVTHVHNPWLHIEANYATSPLRRAATWGGKQLVEGLATHVCGTSREILGRYGFQDGALAVRVVHCGIDVDRFNGPRDDDRAAVRAEMGWPVEARIVLFVGRLDRALQIDHPQNHKNSWLALQIAREAIARDPRIRLVMAGTNAHVVDAVEGHLRGWGLADAIRLVGIRRDVPRLMRAADVLLFPSRQEGLGMVAVEAQAAGLPVLASDAVPRESVVVPSLCRALPLSAPPGEWAVAILEMIEHDRPALEACRAALLASPFAIARSAAALEAIYASAGAP